LPKACTSGALSRKAAKSSSRPSALPSPTMRLNTERLAGRKPRGSVRKGRVSRRRIWPSIRELPLSWIVSALIAARKLVEQHLADFRLGQVAQDHRIIQVDRVVNR
jgi:hypothetical protein